MSNVLAWFSWGVVVAFSLFGAYVLGLFSGLYLATREIRKQMAQGKISRSDLDAACSSGCPHSPSANDISSGEG